MIKVKKDLTGMTFDCLTVIERDYEYEQRLKTPRSCWKCRCICGKIVSVAGGDLTRPRHHSCGCQRDKIEDLTGQCFGYLTVLKYEGKNKRQGKNMWRCKCKCGNETIVSASSLKTGDTFSCGCLKRSKGELLISQILEENNIKYINDKVYFKDLESLNGKLRFDFILFNENNEPYYLIEFDGEQHYNTDSLFDYNYTHSHDLIKNEWCKKNKIPLIRIPYTHLDNLVLEDLLLETSNFIEIMPTIN